AGLGHDLVQRDAAHVLHDQKHAARRGGGAMIFRDVGVLEARQDLNFAAKPLPQRRLRSGFLFQDFDHNLAVAALLAGHIDFAHPAFTQKTVDTKSIEKDTANHRLARGRRVPVGMVFWVFKCKSQFAAWPPEDADILDQSTDWLRDGAGGLGRGTRSSYVFLFTPNPHFPRPIAQFMGLENAPRLP